MLSCQWMVIVPMKFWCSTYLQRLIQLTVVYHCNAYIMCSVSINLCYLASDVISLKYNKLFQCKVFILTNMTCVMVHLKVLSFDIYIVFFVHSLSLVVFTNIQPQMLHVYDNELQMNKDETELLLVTAQLVFNSQHLPELTTIDGMCVTYGP